MKLASIRAFRIYLSFLVFTAIILIPLKIWRAHILRAANVSYYPGEYSLLIKGVREDQKLNRTLKMNAVNPKTDPSQFCITEGFNIAEAFSALQAANKKPINFWSYGTLHLWLVGTLDRLDDLSYWNTIGLIAVAWLVGLAYSATTQNEGPDEKARIEKFKFWHLMAVLAIWGIYGGLPLYVHYRWDHGPIHGAFWTDKQCVPPVWVTQWIDGGLFTLVAGIGAILIVAALRLWLPYIGKKVTDLSHSRVWPLEKLLNAFYVLPILIGVAFGIPGFVKGVEKLGQQELDAALIYALYWSFFVLLFVTTIIWIIRQNTKSPRFEGKPALEIDWARGINSLAYIRLVPHYPNPDDRKETHDHGFDGAV